MDQSNSEQISKHIAQKYSNRNSGLHSYKISATVLKEYDEWKVNAFPQQNSESNCISVYNRNKILKQFWNELFIITNIFK